MKKITFTSILIFIVSAVLSQNQNPNSIKWKQINSEHTQIIFPQEIEKEAQRVANLMDYLYEYEIKTLKTKPEKLPILLFNKSTQSGGFAGLRPRRSVWFSTPSQYAVDLNTNDWYMLLGTHEYRHIVQYSKNNQYFTKFLSVIFGQTGLLMGEYSIPFWFFEGDAISTETAFSNGGRGRIPQFEMPIRTILLENKKNSYDKAKLKSYKDFYPSHYNLGWILTSYARQKYGKNVWNDALTKTSKISFWPYAFSLGLKKTTGKNEKQLYEEAMFSLDSAWTKESEKRTFTKAKIINKVQKKMWTKYTEAHYLSDENIIVKKGDLSEITAFYIIAPDGKEKKLKTTDAGMISTTENKIVWIRNFSDPRRNYLNYSDIIIMDINTKKEKRLTKKGKFHSPAISPNGKKIIAVEYAEDLKCSLVIFDAETGTEIKRFANKNNEFIRTPNWSEDGKKIVFTNNKYKGVALTILNIETEKINEILPHSYENIGRPVFYKNYILYNSPRNGIGNIYAINTKTKEKFQVTSRKYGAYNPKVKNDKLLFIDYTAEGYDIAMMEINPKKFKNITNIDYIYKFKRAEKLFEQEQNKNLLNPDLIPNKKFEVENYKKFKNGLNFHSWGPASDFDSNVKFQLLSANVLNTVFGIAEINYNIPEKTITNSLTARFSKFYPIIDITGSFGERYKEYEQTKNDRWTELKTNLGITLPLNISRNIYNRNIKFSANYEYTQTYDKEPRKYISEKKSGAFSSLKYSGTFLNFRRQSLRDLNPKFGQFFYITYTHTPFNDDLSGSQFSALSSIYFPGIFKNNSLKISGGFELQKEFNSENNESYYLFSSPQSFSRGHSEIAWDKFKTLKIDYQFPLWYPDFNIGPIIYFKRIRAGFFYDYTKIRNLNKKNKIYKSAGIETYIQFHLFRLKLPLETGIRISYIFEENYDGKLFIPEIIILGIPF